MTRVIGVPAGPARRRLDVVDLPEQVLPDSLYAEGEEGTSVLAVRVSPRPRLSASSEEVRTIDQRITELSEQLEQVDHELQVTTTNLELLDQMVDFSVKTGKSDLDRGVLNAPTLTELFTFSVAQRQQLGDAQHALSQQRSELSQQLDRATAERNLATAQGQSLRYQATIFVELGEGQPGGVKLNYLVGGCGWSPQYVVRGRTNEQQVQLRYSALVSQMSGEDWPQVQLTLSTATPSVDASSPQLAPLQIESIEPGARRPNRRAPRGDDPFASAATQPGTALTDALATLRVQQEEAEALIAGADASANPLQRDLVLNSLAGKLQQIELQADAQSWSTVAPDARTDVASQIYRLEQPVSLDSRQENQLVQIRDAQLDAQMHLVATPLLSTFAYREVQMTNTQPIGMLSGPASVYLDDRFVGRTEIPPTASGQRFAVGMGADQQVRTRRELMDKEDTLQGGNRRLTFTYRLVIANFKDQPVSVRLFDRMPVARATKQLSATLAPPTPALSEDGLYLRVARPAGILRWDLDVDAKRHGSDAYDVKYSYTLEFDRNLVPATLDSLAEMQAEYKNLPQGMGGMGGMGGFGGGGGGMIGGGGQPQ